MTAHTNTRAMAPLVGALLLAMLFTPFMASASTTKPTCTLTVTTSAGDTKITSNESEEVIVNTNEAFTLTWTSKNAKTATLDGDDVDTADSMTATSTKDHDYKLVVKNGSKKATCAAELTVVEPASIDTDSLRTKSSKPTLKGSAGGYKTLYVSVSEKGDDDEIFLKKATVKRGDWKFKSSKKLSDGSYDVRLTDKKGKVTYASGTLIIGDAPASAAKLSVGIVPLLSGGTAHANASVPVMYLQIRNTGTDDAHLTGFTVQQTGSASAGSVVRLETVDDKGGSRGASGATPFSGSTGVAPTDAVIAPGQVKLFTIKAIMGGDTGARAGQTLMLDVTGVETDGTVTSTFPIKGVTWTLAQ